MSIKAKVLVVAILVILITGLTAMTNFDLTENYPITNSQHSPSDIVRVVKNTINSDTDTEIEIISETTEYGKELELMLAHCDSTGDLGFVSLYKAPTLTFTTCTNSMKDPTAHYIVNHFDMLKGLENGVVVNKEYALDYVNTYYVYGEEFANKEAELVAEEYFDGKAVVPDAILYMNGQIYFYYLTYSDDLDAAIQIGNYFLPIVDTAQQIKDKIIESDLISEE